MSEDGTGTALLLLKDKVQRYLAEIVDGLMVDGDGDLSFQLGSARVFVRCRTWDEEGEDTLVSLFALLLRDVPSSPELFEYVARHSDDVVFGHLVVEESDDGKLSLVLAHEMLGNYLDPEELKSAAAVVARAADDFDDELQSKFGGVRFHEDA